MTRKLPLNTKRKLRKKRARDLNDDEQRSTRMKPKQAVVGDKRSWRL